MRKLPRRTLATLALFSALFLLTQWLFVPGTFVRSRLGRALQAPKVFFQALANRHTVVSQLSDLSLENQSLRAQIEELKKQPTLIRERDHTYIYARVYSTYPFNNADKLFIGAGSDDGVLEGAAVLVKPGIFLGEVTAVHRRSSEVRTIYDSGWELPVKIGSSGVDSLLVGGHDPRLTLISKKKPAVAGESVLLAVKKYPYGLTLGTVTEVADSDGGLFEEASLTAPYAISDLNSVFIVNQP